MYLQENLEEVWLIRSKNVLTGESGRGLVNKKSQRMYLQENLEEVWSIRSHQDCSYSRNWKRSGQ